MKILRDCPARGQTLRAASRLGLVAGLLAGIGQAVDADLLDLDLAQLAQVKVTSVSKRAEALRLAPAAIYVVGADEIEHAGTTLLPELFRNVPGVHVARAGAHTWAIGSRGFNNPLADKLEVRMDGRSLYTPLFSGVFWDQQLVPLDDIERIEIVRGPAGTLWGSNAVNGVINIIGRRAADTRGLAIGAGAGDELRELRALRYGTGAFGGDLRVSLAGQRADASRAADPAATDGAGGDAWEQVRGGFRGDWGGWSLLGDSYTGDEGGERAPIGIEGRSLALRRQQDGDALLGGAVELHWDQTRRTIEDGFGERRETAALSYERALTVAKVHDIVWGLGYRRSSDRITNSDSLIFDPARRTIDVADGFVQDQWRLGEGTTLTAGTKLERNDFTGVEVQPSLRLAWADPDGATVWAAASRAVRTPNRLDHDARVVGAASGTPEDVSEDLDGGAAGGQPEPPVQATEQSCIESGGNPTLCTLLFGSGVMPVDRPRSYEECRARGLGPRSCELLFDQVVVRDLVGNPDFKSEEVLAYELGWRELVGAELSLDTALFYNVYDRLRGVHTQADGTAVVGNEMEGRSYGAEVLASWQPARTRQIVLGYSYLHLDLEPRAGSNDTRTEASEGNNPRHQAFLRFLWRPQPRLSAHFALRSVGELPNQRVPAYTELDADLSWRLAGNLRLRLTGNNLLHQAHAEFGAQQPNLIERSVFLSLRWGR
ncbi:MAG: TonB-dependent receptor [Gammaproteobacteria bacterium]|nr:TonB-dependent receptor [Gammaproteobacteria bacterium]